jgi:hypothetical protein
LGGLDKITRSDQGIDQKKAQPQQIGRRATDRAAKEILEKLSGRAGGAADPELALP